MFAALEAGFTLYTALVIGAYLALAIRRVRSRY